MPTDPKPTPDRKPEEQPRETPRTDLPPGREPYYEGYFGTEEEEGVVREEDSGDADRRASREDEDPAEAARRISEDAAGGDREIT